MKHPCRQSVHRGSDGEVLFGRDAHLLLEHCGKMLLAGKAHVQGQICQRILGVHMLIVDGLGKLSSQVQHFVDELHWR